MTLFQSIRPPFKLSVNLIDQSKLLVTAMPNQATVVPNYLDQFIAHADGQKLKTLCSEQTYKEGLLYFKQDRVIEHYQQQDSLISRVEGSDADVPYELTLSFEQQGQLSFRCPCMTHTNTTTGLEVLLCKHSVATMLAFFDANQNNKQYAGAKDSAIADRIKRGHNEVNIERVNSNGPFSTWQASSIVSNTNVMQQYTVTLRALSERINSCTCPDLANNQLATCKHIEAVLHHVDGSHRSEFNVPKRPFVYRDFGESCAIKIQRSGTLSPALAALIDQYFDGLGRFKGELPNDFFSFSDQVFSTHQIDIGEDAKLLVKQMLDQQAHQLKSLKVHQQIIRSEGNIAGINAKLYPYQLEGVAFLAANGRGLLADDMGLGKTLQAIAAATWLTNQAAVKRVLIVCPASLKHQWAREIEKFTGMDSQIIQGNAAKRHAQYSQDKTFFIINYELVLRDLSVINEVLAADLLILDEAQRIKNWRTKIAASIKLLHSQYAFVLTGTPLENRLEDLYSLMQVVDQQVLGPLWRYLNDHHISDESGKVMDYRNLAKLRQRISDKMLRRNRSIVADQLPGRSTIRLDVAMSQPQWEVHDSAMSAAGNIANIAKTRPLTPSESNRLMAALQQARMACDAAGLVDKQTVGSPKLSELKTLIEEQCIDNGLKMVVFSQWRGMTTMVENMLRQMNVGFVHLHGGVPTHKRGVLMDAFKDDDSVSVFVSTDAGGSGLNLQSASVLVNLDMPWNPAVLEQRNARVHRLGQTNHVQIILMIAENSYEQRVFQLVNDKQDLFDNVVDPEASEDVIGVSKKALSEVVSEVIGDLPDVQQADDTNTDADNAAPVDKAQAPIRQPRSVERFKLPEQLQSKHDEQIKTALLDIQRHFGERLEQIKAKGGGLLVILSSSNFTDSIFIDTLEIDIPIAIFDVKNLAQLQQMGVDPITADSQTIQLPPAQGSNISPWVAQMNKKLATVGFLLSQSSQSGNADVIELICSAIALLLTEKAQMEQLVSIEELPVWLYTEAVPEEHLSIEQAYIISRIIGLRLADPIPVALLEQCYADIKDLAEQLLKNS